VLRASFRLAPCLLSSLTESCDPKKGKARDASDQLLPPERYCDCPYLVGSWFAPRLSSRGRPTESWAPCDLPGDRVLHGTRNASADLQWTHTALPLESSRLATRSSRAWTFSVHGAHGDRASDTSVATPLLPQKRSVRLRAAFLSRALPLRACVTLLREEAAKAAVTIFS